MKKMDYESIKVVETTQFDNVAYAQSELHKCEVKVKFGMILTLCALPYTLIMLLMMANSAIGDNPVVDFLAPVITIIALVAVLVGVVMLGVLGIIFRLAKKVVFWCWMLVPIFPIDLGIALVGGFVVVLSILTVPALYLAVGTYAAHSEKSDAEAFLAIMMAKPTQKQTGTSM